MNVGHVFWVMERHFDSWTRLISELGLVAAECLSNYLGTLGTYLGTHMLS